MGRIAEALKKAEAEREEHSVSQEALAPLSPLMPGDDPGATAPEPGKVSVIQPVEGMSPDLVAYYDRAAMITEQYRALRTRLLSQNPHNEHRILAVTSSVPKEGKSVTTANLGFTLAEVQHLRVLLVDGDFRRSSLANMLNVSSEPGLANLLRGDGSVEQAIQPTPLPNMFVLPAGNTKGFNAAELWSSNTAHDLFQRFHSEFHYTLVDTPPACTVTDVGIIGQLCSGVLMVVRMHSTTEPMAKRAARLLQANNVPIIGCLLAGHNERGLRYGYSYNYYYNYYRKYYGSDGRNKS